MVVGFGLIFFFWKDNIVEEEVIIDKIMIKKENIISLVKGWVLFLKNVEDFVFVNGVLGNGVVIELMEGKVVVFFDGMIVILFLIKYVLGLILDNGIELLIYIGIDIV